jgi:histidinol-phosphate aminotransferase
MSAFSRFTPLIASLPSTIPFVGPEAIERQRNRPIAARIGANESGFGPAPSVLKAMTAAASGVWQYNDPENFGLKAALAGHLGIAAENVAIGEGIDGLLGQIVRMVIEPGMPVVTLAWRLSDLQFSCGRAWRAAGDGSLCGRPRRS